MEQDLLKEYGEFFDKFKNVEVCFGIIKEDEIVR